MELFESILKWRDLVIALVTGIFVLQFAAAEKINSHVLVFGTTPLQDVALGVIVVTSVLLVVSAVLAVQLNPSTLSPVEKPQTPGGRHTFGEGLRRRWHKWKYWIAFAICVLPWYIGSGFLVFAPEA